MLEDLPWLRCSDIGIADRICLHPLRDGLHQPDVL